MLCSVDVTTKIFPPRYSETYSSISQPQTTICYKPNKLVSVLISFVPDTNECASNPCQYGSTCTDEIDGYTCICASGYEGTNCGTGMSIQMLSTKIHKKYTLYHSLIH